MERLRRRRLASWNRERDVWETDTMGLFSEHLDVFSETLPTSGMTRGGVLFELQMSEPRTGGRESLSLLPTPTASLGTCGGSEHPSKHREGGHSVTLKDVAEKA